MKWGGSAGRRFVGTFARGPSLRATTNTVLSSADAGDRAIAFIVWPSTS